MSHLATQFGVATYSDITFSVAGKLFHGHKVILSQHEYFRALFSNSKDKKVIELSGVSADVLQIVLHFAYGKQSGIPKPLVLEVLSFAHMSLMDDLCYMCEDLLMDVVDDESLIECLRHAHFFDAPRLKQFCLSYAQQREVFQTISTSAAYQELVREDPELHGELMEAICDHLPSNHPNMPVLNHRACKRRKFTLDMLSSSDGTISDGGEKYDDGDREGEFDADFSYGSDSYGSDNKGGDEDEFDIESYE